MSSGIPPILLRTINKFPSWRQLDPEQSNFLTSPVWWFSGCPDLLFNRFYFQFTLFLLSSFCSGQKFEYFLSNSLLRQKINKFKTRLEFFKIVIRQLMVYFWKQFKMISRTIKKFFFILFDIQFFNSHSFIYKNWF